MPWMVAESARLAADMGRVAALLAAALASIVAIAACGDDGGAEPGAPEGATLVLDFQPNAVHAPIYAARSRGYLEDAGIDLEIREPSSSADAAKLLQAGRADFAILDINDFGLGARAGHRPGGRGGDRRTPARIRDRRRSRFDLRSGGPEGV